MSSQPQSTNSPDVTQPTGAEMAAVQQAPEPSPSWESDRHLALYHDALELANGSLALFALPNKRCFASEDPLQVGQRAALWGSLNQNVYIHTLLHRLAPGDHARRGSIDSASIAIGLVSDIDARGP